MEIAVIGASGRTGVAFVNEARARGHSVVAVVRDPSRLSITVDRIETADARNPADLALALRGVDVVLTTVGPGPDSAHGIVTESIHAIIEAMRRAKLRRLMMVSATGPFADSADSPLLRYVLKPVVQRILRATFADIADADAVVQASDLDWTIVRPPQLADGAPRGYQRNPRWGLRITRADLAIALVDALESPETTGRVIAVAN